MKQSDLLAPLLFNLFLNAITITALETQKHIGVEILFKIKDSSEQ